MLLIFCPAVNLSGVISQLFLSLLSHCHYTKSTSLPPDDTPLDALSVPLSFPVPFLYKSPPHMDSARRMLFYSNIPSHYFHYRKSDQSYRLITLPFYRINIASPKLKKRYLSLIASSYAFNTCSLPANAETSITSVDSGRWKFVIRQSSTLN